MTLFMRKALNYPIYFGQNYIDAFRNDVKYVYTVFRNKLIYCIIQNKKISLYCNIK